MKRDIRKKRFFISVILLLCGVFALYPYLGGGPRRVVIRSVSGLEDRALAVSVVKAVLLGDALTDRTRALSLSSEMRGRVAKLRTSLQTLKKELSAMSEKPAQLSASAMSAYENLEGELTEFIAVLPESVE